MNTQDPEAQDRRLIEELIQRWAYARDSDDWSALEDCFHPDAQIHISWISASAQEFVLRSQAMALHRRPGSHMKHLMAGSWVEVNGPRGFSRSSATLLLRDCVDGVWFDIESHIRFFDRLERRDGKWRLVERTGVYDKDRIDALGGTALPLKLLQQQDIDTFLPEARHLCWWLAARGMQPLPDLIPVYSEQEKRLRDACRAWMDSGIPRCR